MKSNFYKKTSFILFGLIIFLNPVPLQAQWSDNPAENTLVCGAEKDQKEPAVVSDAAGGVFISWRDYRFTESIFGGEIYAQRVDSSGFGLWTENGLQVNASGFNKGHFRPRMTEGPDSCAIIVWNRGPLFFYNYDIFAQRLNENGAKVWPLNDVTISDTAGTESFHQVISDHDGGALVVWTYLPGTPGTTDILAQRVDADGKTLWQKNGAPVCTAAESQANPVLARDGYKGAVIVWEDSRAGIGTVNVYAQRMDSSGHAKWQADGLEINDYPDRQGVAGIVSDDNGGAVILYTYAGEEGAGLYAQCVNADGERKWGSNGVKICSTYTDQYTCDAVQDDVGGVLVVWQDNRSGNNIYAQRINSSGQALWTDNGVPVSSALNDQLSPVALADGAGGMIIIWQDKRNDAAGDLYAQRLNNLGLPLWQINGIAVANAAGEQSQPVSASDGQEGAIFVWQDNRNGTDYDIYAQRVDKNGHFGELSDLDNDGIADTLEQGPQGTDPAYDGNGDNTPDWQQGNVASFYTYDKQHYVTLAVPDSVSLENTGAMDNPNPDAPGVPLGATAPFGFFTFTIAGLTPGSHTVATLFLEADPAFNYYYKYGPLTGQPTGWYDFIWDGETGAMIHTDTVFLYLTDGKRGDYDMEANGRITDPGGPLQTATLAEPLGKDGFYLQQSRPNPVTDYTIITFSIPALLDIRMELFNITGRKVAVLANGPAYAGKHTLTWNARNMPAGIYILVLTAGERSVVRKMVIR